MIALRECAPSNFKNLGFSSQQVLILMLGLLTYKAG